VGIVVRGEIRGVEETLREFSHDLDESVRRALQLIGANVAQTAQANHPWQNRTTALQTNTRDEQAEGSFMADSLTLEVVGDTDYGEYLEEKPQWAYLTPAWESQESRTESDFDAAVQAACDSAFGAH
jgi:hypothetical protein